jgi:hypothetical protein
MASNERHRWDRTGSWQGSKDVRTCERCGAKAFKTGMYSGHEVTWPGEQAQWFKRMPPCRGDLKGKEE